MHRDCYIGLGSNLGDRNNYLDSALARMEAVWGVGSVRSSRYQTPPWGMSAGSPDFINQVVCFRLARDPKAILVDLLAIEAGLGRHRDAAAAGYQSRTIDLDLLAVEGIQLDSPTLTLPHPRIAMRRFVLEPLTEIAPDFKLVHDGPPVRELLRTCPDEAPVHRIPTPA